MSITDFTLTRESLRRKLRAALEDVPGDVEIRVEEGTFGRLAHHLKPTEHDDEHGFLVKVRVRDIPNVPNRWVGCDPWIRIDDVEPENLQDVLDEAVKETAEAVRKTVQHNIDNPQETP